jgi:PIN domain nuclease of toxin-antitoxin system
MNYLIDTQILIWYQLNSPNLKAEIAEILKHKDNLIFVSDISLIEIVIKQKIYKLPEFNIDINDIGYV